jgi:hypothetical protein
MVNTLHIHQASHLFPRWFSVAVSLLVFNGCCVWKPSVPPVHSSFRSGIWWSTSECGEEYPPNRCPWDVHHLPFTKVHCIQLLASSSPAPVGVKRLDRQNLIISRLNDEGKCLVGYSLGMIWDKSFGMWLFFLAPCSNTQIISSHSSDWWPTTSWDLARKNESAWVSM